MLNKESILKQAEKFLPQGKMGLLNNAYDFADKITDATQNPQEALQRAGVTLQDLQKAKKWVNNPIAGFFLGDKKQEVINGLNKIESLLLKGNLPAEQAPVSELEQMQRNLASLR